MDLLLFGLGNPGSQYRDTRHNVGYLTSEKVAAEQGLALRKPLFRRYRLTDRRTAAYGLRVVQPLTFMNNSGEILGQVMRRTGMGLDNLIVVCDNLDLPAGTTRLKRGGGDAGHNGLKSIIAHAGGGAFLRLFIGVGHPRGRGTVVDWVLGTPENSDRELIHDAICRAAASIQVLLVRPLEQVMNELNSKR